MASGGSIVRASTPAGDPAWLAAELRQRRGTLTGGVMELPVTW